MEKPTVKIKEITKIKDEGWRNFEMDTNEKKYVEFLPNRGTLGKINDAFFNWFDSGKNQDKIMEKSIENQSEINEKSEKNHEDIVNKLEETGSERLAYQFLKSLFEEYAEKLHRNNSDKISYLKAVSKKIMYYESMNQWYACVNILNTMYLNIKKQELALINNINRPEPLTDKEYMEKHSTVVKRLKAKKYWKITSISNELRRDCGDAAHSVIEKCIEIMKLQRQKNRQNTKRLLSAAAIIFIFCLVGFKLWTPAQENNKVQNLGIPQNLGTPQMYTTNVPATYHVIVGTFKEKKNAENFKKRFKKATILTDREKCRVSVYYTTNLDSAKIKSKEVNGLVLKI